MEDLINEQFAIFYCDKTKTAWQLAIIGLIICGISYGIFCYSEDLPHIYFIPFPILLSAWFVLDNLRDLNYIKVSPHYVVFKAYTKGDVVFKVGDIKEISFDRIVRGYKGHLDYKLTVTTDYKIQRFSTTMIMGTQGKELKDKLESAGITVKADEGLFSE